ncbi:MAG TPA: hypothetical protein VEF89_26680 [Solirubrobacteraceae bacterium]|nr:hypothetical protein [Solirubrobacteraceae bacterium]
MPFEFRIAVEADEPGRTVAVSIDEPMETISPKLGLIECGPLKVVLTLGGIVGDEERTWLYADEARKVAEALSRAADAVQAGRA